MPKQDVVQNDYNGYPLFNGADKEIRFRNRGTIMANITEDFSEDGKVTAQGTSLILGYFNAVPAVERKATMSAYRAELDVRGIMYA